MHIYLYFPVIRHLASTRGTPLFPTCPPASLTALTGPFHLHWSPLQPYLPHSHLSEITDNSGSPKGSPFPLLIWIYLSKHAPPPSLEIISGETGKIHEFSHPSDEIHILLFMGQINCFPQFKSIYNLDDLL